MRSAVYLVAVLTLALPVTAQNASSAIVVKQACSRATSSGARVAAGYLTVTNAGKVANHLLSIESPMAERVELHESSVVDSIARMRPVDAIPVAVGATVTLKPGGLHLMLMQPRSKRAPGDKVPVTLTFEVGKVSVALGVQLAGASDAPANDHTEHV